MKYLSEAFSFFTAKPQVVLPARNDHLSRRALGNTGMEESERPRQALCVSRTGLARVVFSRVLCLIGETHPEGQSVSQSGHLDPQCGTIQDGCSDNFLCCSADRGELEFVR